MNNANCKLPAPENIYRILPLQVTDSILKSRLETLQSTLLVCYITYKKKKKVFNRDYYISADENFALAK